MPVLLRIYPAIFVWLELKGRTLSPKQPSLQLMYKDEMIFHPVGLSDLDPPIQVSPVLFLETSIFYCKIIFIIINKIIINSSPFGFIMAASSRPRSKWTWSHLKRSKDGILVILVLSV